MTTSVGSNPYVGPRAIETGEPIFGRDRELRQLFQLMVARRIVLLHSPSGAGKTSLVKAGLIPRLVEEGFEVLPVARLNLEPQEIQAGDGHFNRYVFSLLQSLEENLPDDLKIPVEKLAGLSLSQYLNLRVENKDGEKFVVLVIDQGEDVLTIDPTDVAQKTDFFAQLGEMLRNPHLWALFVMREDYLGALEPYVRAIPTRLANTYRLDLLGTESALEAIQEPARLAKVDFSDEAAGKLVDDLSEVSVQQPDGSFIIRPGPHVEPVQLQVVCYRLWNSLPPGTTRIGAEQLASVGDVDDSLAEYYAEQVMAAAAESGVGERDIRRWFENKLITPDGLRGQIRMGVDSSGELENGAIRRLVDAHLVRAEQRRGLTWYELAHDRLVAPLRRSNQDWFEEHLSLLQRQADLWVQQGKPEGLILGGQALADAEQWAGRHQGSMSQDEVDFLAACQKARQAAARLRRRSLLIAAVGIAAILLAILSGGLFIRAQNNAAAAERNLATANAASTLAVANAQDAENNAKIAATNEAIAMGNQSAAETASAMAFDYALEAQQQSRIARARELAALALNQIDKRLDLALLLGIEAYRFENNTLQARQALHAAWSYNPRLTRFLSGHSDYVVSVAWSADGRLASGSVDGTLIVWDLESGVPETTLEGHSDWVTSLAWSADGRLASGSDDGRVIVWDLESGEVETTLDGYSGPVSSVAWSPDGRLASGADDGTVIVWGLERGQAETTLEGHADWVYSVAWSPDGRLASGSEDRTLIVWDLESGEAETILIGHSFWVRSVAWSRDGRLASGSEDGTAIVWDLARGQAETTLVGHSGRVNSVAWSPDGRLASGSFDGTAIVWGLERGQAETTLEGHADWVYSVAWSPDGRLASGSFDDTVKVWQMNPGVWIEQSCRRAGRNFTRSEWALYFPDEAYRKTCVEYPLEPMAQP